MDKCIVLGCTNHQGEGRFVGELCAPCYTMLTQGKKMPSDAWFAKEWVGLTDDEMNQCSYDAEGFMIEREVTMRAVEAKIREKNA